MVFFLVCFLFICICSFIFNSLSFSYWITHSLAHTCFTFFDFLITSASLNSISILSFYYQTWVDHVHFIFWMCLFCSFLLLLLFKICSFYWLLIVFCFSEILSTFLEYFDERWNFVAFHWIMDVFYTCGVFICVMYYWFCILYVQKKGQKESECVCVRLWFVGFAFPNVTQIHMSKRLYCILKDIRALNRFLQIFLQTLMNCL